MNDHGFVSFVVIKVEPSILCGNEWSWICFREYLVQLWLRLTKHIHDHSLPHIILVSTLITTNGTYTWSFITTQNTWFNLFCVVMNDHGFVSFVVIKAEPSILCGNEWSWICFLCHSHGWPKNHDYDKRNISMIIHYHTEYLVQLWLRQTKHIHDHSLPHRILGSPMTTTNETYPWSFITTHNNWFNYDYVKRNISMIIHYHTEYLPSIMCGNEWPWICFVCRSHS
jgi:hypothetical protein